MITQQAVQEISPAYVNCSGFIESTYNGIIEQTEFNAPSATLRMHIITQANSDGPSYCPRYEIELWFRSEVSGPAPFDPALIGQFTGLGDVVAYLQQDGDSIEGKASYQSALEMDQERCPYEAMSGNTQVSSDQQQLQVNYNGEDSCDALKTSQISLGSESSDMTGIGY